MKSIRKSCLLLLAISSVASARQARQPNVVILYADDLGYGDLSCYGATAVETPHSDRLAKEGTKFTSAYCTAATCTPSRYALITGRYAWRQKGTNILDGDDPLIVSTTELTLPKLFKRAGYSTGIVGKWHLGLGEGRPRWNDELKPGPLEVGFDESFVIPATVDRTPCVFVRNRRVANLDPKDPITVGEQAKGTGPTKDTRPDLLKQQADDQHNGTIINGISRIGYMTGGTSARWVDQDICDVLAGEATRFIKHHAADDKPFFLIYGTHDIHAPRDPNPRFIGATKMGPRGDSIVQFDYQVGAVLDTLDSLKLADDTIVILTSDNGPILLDGYLDRADELLGAHTPWGPFRGTKYSILEAGTRVPFVIRWPGRVPAEKVSDALISQVDLGASFASLLQQPLKDEEFPDSFDLKSELLGGAGQGRPYLVQESWSALGLRAENWKYITPTKAAAYLKTKNIDLGYSMTPQLFDLAVDPQERNNRAAEAPAVLRAFQALEEQLRANPNSRATLREFPLANKDREIRNQRGEPN